jgi:CubicO group peptidase (beta-lactamase class C family)
MQNLQDTIQTHLDQLVAEGTERGVQAAVYYQGELIVDAFAGTMSPEGESVTPDTLFPVFSTTKGMLATIAHRLVERGLFDYDTPLATFWPEFATHGKGAITLRHALTHSAGLPYMPLNVGIEEINDWDFVCAAIAELKPVFAPGERIEYHAITQSWLVGEIACRATGFTFPELWRQEISAPLDLEESLFCGLPAQFDSRVATLEEPTPPTPEKPAEPTPEAIPYWIWPLSGWMNRTDAKRSSVPASNGIMNARAIAHHYAALLPGGVAGVELLPPSRVQIASTRNLNHNPEPLPAGLGYGVGAPEWPTISNGGYGGSFGLADPTNGWAFGFTRNLFTDTNPAGDLLNKIKDAMQSY